MALINYFGFDSLETESGLISLASGRTLQVGRRPESKAWSPSGTSTTEYGWELAYTSTAGAVVTIGFAFNKSITFSGDENWSSIRRIDLFEGQAINSVGISGVKSVPAGWKFAEIVVGTGSTPNVDIYIDGELYAQGASSSTSVLGLRSRCKFRLPTSSIDASCKVDDFYVLDSSGPSFNQRLGDIQVDNLYPNADGKANQWVNSTGNQTNNWSYVDEDPVSVLDFVESDVTGNSDWYNLQNLPAGRLPLAAKVHAFAGKNDSGERWIQVGVDSGGTEVWTPKVSLNQSPSLTTSSPIINNPATGLPWDSAAINALQAGVKVVDP